MHFIDVISALTRLSQNIILFNLGLTQYMDIHDVIDKQ